MISTPGTGVLLKQAIHPGRYILDELEERGWTSEDLADKAKRSPSSLKRVLRGRAPVTKPLAKDLESVLGLSAGVMLRLQKSYQETIQRLESEPDIQADIALLREGAIPWRELAKRGWIYDVGTDVERVSELRVMYDVDALIDVENGRHEAAFRMTKKTRYDPWALAAWLQQGNWQLIEGQWESDWKQAAHFDPQLFEQSLAEIRRLTITPDFWQQMRSLCASAGVHLEVVPHVRKSGANGVTRWMDDGRPLIQLSLFRGWADVFWFTFFHEAAHVLKEDHRDMYINLDRVPREDDVERQADDFARDFLISPDHWQPYWAHEHCSRTTINRLADEVGVHPGIVVGRLQHEKRIPYSAHNDLRTKLEYGLFGVEAS